MHSALNCTSHWNFSIILQCIFDISPYIITLNVHNKAPVTHSLQPVGDLLATKILGGCRVVARRSATGRRPVAEGCRDDLVARRFWLLQVKPLCDQIDRRKVFGGRQQVGDRLATDRRPVAAVADNPDTVFSRRPIADRLLTDLQKVADFLQSKMNSWCLAHKL